MASRFLAVKSLESLTPKATSVDKCSSFIMTPAMTSGPMMHPLPASSMPATNMTSFTPSNVNALNRFLGYNVFTIRFLLPEDWK